MPDISVVIPTFNRKGYLKQAINSCFKGNDGVHVEVVVVDDGSTDGTRDLLRHFDNDRVRPIFQEHQGGQVARNRGLAEAGGQFVKFLDDDDWLAEGALTKEVALLSDAGGDMVTGGCQFVDADHQAIGHPQFSDFTNPIVACFDGAIQPQPLCHSYRTEFARKAKWDESLPCRQDFAFVLDLALCSPRHANSKIMCGFKCQHEEGLSKQPENERRGAAVHLDILQRAAKELANQQDVDSIVKQAAASGLWRWGRLRAVESWEEFRRSCEIIADLHPDFRPTRSLEVLALLDRVMGPIQTEKLLLPLRRAKYAFP